MRLKFALIFFLLIQIGLPCNGLAMTMEQAVNQLSEQITSEISTREKQKIAVAELCDLNGRVTKLGKYIAEEILIQMAREGKVNIVERQYLKKVLQETEFKSSGITDAKSAQKIGLFLGADAICIGTITVMPKTIRIHARLVDAKTGAVFGVASVDVDRSPDTDYLMSDEEVQPPAEVKKPKPVYKKGNLIFNGDFSKHLDGWQRQIGDITKGYSQAAVISFPHSKSGKALHITHKGEGHIQFSQVVPVAGPDLIFSLSFQVHSHEGNIIGFSGSGVVQVGLIYSDDNGNKLGETVLVNYVKNPFADTPLIGVPRRDGDTYSKHFIEIPKGQYKQNYQIDIRKELENNLMGITPDAVNQIAVVLWCGATHGQAGSELWITDIKLSKR
jgi:TolB-like protein